MNYADVVTSSLSPQNEKVVSIFFTNEKNIIPIDKRTRNSKIAVRSDNSIDFCVNGVLQESISIIEGNEIPQEIKKIMVGDQYWFGDELVALYRLPLYGIVHHPVFGKIIVETYLNDQYDLYWSEKNEPYPQKTIYGDTVVSDERITDFMKKHNLTRNSLFYDEDIVVEMYPELANVLSWWQNIRVTDEKKLEKTAKKRTTSGVVVSKELIMPVWDVYRYMLTITHDNQTWSFTRMSYSKD